MRALSRRLALKIIGLGSAWFGLNRSQQSFAQEATEIPNTPEPLDNWRKTHDRVWLGSQFWANPMEDWRVVSGAAECQTGGGDRNIHLITHQFTNPMRDLAMSVLVS